MNEFPPFKKKKVVHKINKLSCFYLFIYGLSVILFYVGIFNAFRFQSHVRKQAPNSPFTKFLAALFAFLSFSLEEI